MGADNVDVCLYEAATERLVARRTSVAYHTGHAAEAPRELVSATQGLGVRCAALRGT